MRAAVIMTSIVRMQEEKLVLNRIKITPLAAESFGVRSMCTLVETPDVTILLDAGISLCPFRFGLPPHPLEFRTISFLRRRIEEAAKKAEIITISHYHFDHHTPSFEDWLVNWTVENETARHIYEGKRVLMKNPREKINPSQRQRAWLFRRTSGKYAKKMEAADGKKFILGADTVLRFSEAVPHGPDGSKLGWVVIAFIDCGDERFVFAPDIQGPMSGGTLELIKKEKPQVLMLGGPPFYLSGLKVEETTLSLGTKNLAKIVEEVPLTILEHHTLRDASWMLKTRLVFERAAQKNHKVLTAAEFAGFENNFLETRRRNLFKEVPPSREFQKWMRKDYKKRIHIEPPI